MKKTLLAAAAPASAAASAGQRPRVLVKTVKTAGGATIRIKCDSGDLIADLRDRFAERSINPQSTLFVATDATQLASATTSEGLVPANDFAKVKDGMCLLAVPPVGGGGGAAAAPPADLVALRKAILEANQVGSLITLSGDAEWPQLGGVPLFVRHFYDGCYTGPLQSLTADKKARFRKFVILGNPGIGKSAFGCYLIWRALRNKRAVVYQSLRLQSTWVFHSDGSVSEFAGEAKYNPVAFALLKEYSTVFISDAITPPAVRAFTVLITSPKREVWFEYNKNGNCSRLVFPVYSWQEIVQLQETSFPDVAGGMDGVRKRYARWGGIPRYVLDKTDEAEQEILESALDSADDVNLALYLKGKEIEDGVSHRLLHLKTRGELEPALAPDNPAFYRLFRSELGSRYIADKICEAIMTATDNKLRSLLASPKPTRSVTKLYGEVFERFAEEKLANGGRFRMRLLVKKGSSPETLLQLPARSASASLPAVAGFQTLEELKTLSSASATRLLHPTSKSFCAVDFILQGKRPANATVNKGHELILTSQGKNTPSGLLPVAAALGLSLPINFYWIVPEDDFDSWKRPRRLLRNGVAAGAQDDTTIQQYVVAVRFDVKSLAATSFTEPAGASTATPKQETVGSKRGRPSEEGQGKLKMPARKRAKRNVDEEADEDEEDEEEEEEETRPVASSAAKRAKGAVATKSKALKKKGTR